MPCGTDEVHYHCNIGTDMNVSLVEIFQYICVCMLLARGLIRSFSSRGRRALRLCACVAFLLALSASLSALLPHERAEAQQFDLNQFRGSETAKDGLYISTAADQGHLRFGAQVYLDFSDDPLMFAETPIVHQQLTGELITSLGLWSRLIVFAGLPYHFIIRGDGNSLPDGTLSTLAPTGGGLGDFRVGARVRAWGEEKDIAQLAVQGTFFVYTASMADSNQMYRGGPHESPRLGGEVELLSTLHLRDDLHLSRTSVTSSARTSCCLRVPSSAMH